MIPEVREGAGAPSLPGPSRFVNQTSNALDFQWSEQLSYSKSFNVEHVSYMHLHNFRGTGSGHIMVRGSPIQLCCTLCSKFSKVIGLSTQLLDPALVWLWDPGHECCCCLSPHLPSHHQIWQLGNSQGTEERSLSWPWSRASAGFSRSISDKAVSSACHHHTANG